MPFRSMKLLRVGGISLELHPTFYLLPLYVAVLGWFDEGLRGVWTGLLALALVYISVVLHEFGHALTARRLGIGVRHIVLTPVGGMALLEQLPRNPVKELLIVVAGPAVNFVIAGICVSLLHGWPAHLDEIYDVSLRPASLLRYLLQANLMLGLFNLLPAFPMDGGRIVRALLALGMDYVSATYWAMMIGRVVAVTCIVLALFAGSYMLVVLFMFILVLGTWEFRHVLQQELQNG
ncbi:MAG TPA: M50 family metallopeptidase [Opitutales bacterium]|nr:M50 family metallopeptidase [Opitutales bacterium]